MVSFSKAHLQKQHKPSQPPFISTFSFLLSLLFSLLPTNPEITRHFQLPTKKIHQKQTTMFLLFPTFFFFFFFFFFLTIFLTSFLLILLLHHYFHLYIIHLFKSSSPLTLNNLHLPHWFSPPPRPITTQKPLLVKQETVKMTLKGSTSQACAACKYQRRKCTPDCPLAPYFPPDQPKLFQNAHKLFGVCNILKFLKTVDPRLRFDTMKSIITQANIRDKFPVHGCWEVIRQLQYQIMAAEHELQNVYKQIELYGQHYISTMPNYVTSELELGMAPPNNNIPISVLHHSTYDNNNNGIPYCNESEEGHVSAYDTELKQNAAAEFFLWAQNPFTSNNSSSGNKNNDNAETVQSHMLVMESEDVHNYDQLHQFFNNVDDRQSYVDSKDANDSCSSEESLKNTAYVSTDHAADNTLQNAE